MAEEAKEKDVKKVGVGRRILKIALWLVGVLLLALVTSPLWLGPVARGVANSIVPSKTGCKFTLEELSINPFTGRVFLRECHLKNPEGYRKEEAFSVSTVVVDVAVCSLLSDEIHVETIEVRGLYASYLSDSKGVNNFDRIIATATGTEPGAEPEEEEPEADKKEEENEKPGPKVVIDHFELTDSEVSYGIVRGTPPITLPLPSVTLNDIGKEKEGGITFAEAGNVIWQACLKVAGKAGESVKKLGKMAADGAAAVGSAAADAATALGDAAGNAATAVGDAAGKAANAVGDAAGKTVDAVGNAAGKAVDAVGGAAGKAVKSIGNLFKGDDK